MVLLAIGSAAGALYGQEGVALMIGIGSLLMHFMLETIMVANLLGLNAFNQPAVEEGKAMAKKSLLIRGRN